MPSSQAHRFLEWFSNQHWVNADRNIPIQELTIGQHAETREGREWIAHSYLNPIRNRLEILRADEFARTRDVRDLILTLEVLIHLYPEEESFSPPLMEIRGVISELCGLLNTISVTEAQPLPYNGPRPSRLERINNDSTVEESTDQWGMSGIR